MLGGGGEAFRGTRKLAVIETRGVYADVCSAWGCELATKIKLKATAQLCACAAARWERGLFKYWSSHWAQFHPRREEEVNECISATVFFRGVYAAAGELNTSWKYLF